MYKNWKIGKKIITAFAIVVIISVIMMVFALYCLRDVGNMSHQLFTGPYVSTTEAMGIRYDLNAIGKDIRSAIIYKDLDSYLPVIESNKKQLDERIVKIKSVFGGDPQLVLHVESAEAALAIERDAVVSAIKAKNYDKAATLLTTTYMEAYTKTADASDVLYNNADQRAIDFDVNSQKTTSSAVAISIALLVLSVALAIALSFVATRAITRPMKKVEDAMEEMSTGSLNIVIDYESKDELGVLAGKMRFISVSIANIIKDIGYVLDEMANGNFNVQSKAADTYIRDYAPILTAMKNINTKLSDTLGQINQASDQVSSGSDQVSSGAQALSQGATEQASSVEELSATITEISEKVKANASDALDASRQVGGLRNELEASNQQMQEMIGAMTEISNSSNQIGKIIKTIEDIAFQTNILALNAAVEAARAGAAGKGFAVVAEEVRSLAGKSQEAAKNTTTLIQGSIEAVGRGTKLADGTAKSLLQVVDGAKNVTVTVDKISAASSEQAGSIAQVTQGIEQISSVVQTNSATAEESAAASEELSSQAQVLKQLVGKFQLKNSGGSTAAQSYTQSAPKAKRSQISGEYSGKY